MPKSVRQSRRDQGLRGVVVFVVHTLLSVSDADAAGRRFLRQIQKVGVDDFVLESVSPICSGV